MKEGGRVVVVSPADLKVQEGRPAQAERDIPKPWNPTPGKGKGKQSKARKGVEKSGDFFDGRRLPFARRTWAAISHATQSLGVRSRVGEWMEME